MMGIQQEDLQLSSTNTQQHLLVCNVIVKQIYTVEEMSSQQFCFLFRVSI